MDTSLQTSVISRADLAPSSVVVPLDGSVAATSALAVARWVCRLFDAPLERVTVEIGSGDAVGVVNDDGGAQLVLYGDGVGSALTGHLAERPGALLCMAARSRGRPGRHLSGDLVDHLVASGAAPMVVVGPNGMDEDLSRPPATILLAANDQLPVGSTQLCARWALAADAQVVVARARSTDIIGVGTRPGASTDHGGSEFQDGFLGGVASAPAGPDDALLGHLEQQLADVGIHSTALVLAGGSVATTLLAFAERLPQPVLIVAPTGERDGRIPGEVTHQLLQRSRWPVVVSLGAAS